jgi:magnesium chelatase subunit D
VSETEGARAWADALLAGTLLAVDPPGLGGVVLEALPGAVRDRWLGELNGLLPEGTPVHRFLPHMDDASLVGGLDLAATLSAGRPRVRPGLLPDSDRGLLLLPMAERLRPGQVAMLGAALDQGEVRLERDGFSRVWPARLGLVVLDEAVEGEDPCAQALRDRCAFHLRLHAVSVRDTGPAPYGTRAVLAARRRLAGVSEHAELVAALCKAADGLGVRSLRAPLLALRAARAAAALVGTDEVGAAQAKLAVRLVFGSRAQQVPEPPADQEPPPPSSADQDGAEAPPPDQDEQREVTDLDELTELLVEAAAEVAKPDLGRRLCRARVAANGPAGRAGPVRLVSTRGRPVAAVRGEPGGGRRLDLLATLRAAAPFQRLRRPAAPDGGDRGLVLRRDDLRVRRFQQHAATLTIFAVDASGSAAVQRLGEAKGAVELLLGDCYVRRDSVALLAFRGRGADLLLPPTRSLVRAKRSLTHLAGGGATPLAAGIDAAAALAARSLNRGLVPNVVLLTDGRGNVTREGLVDRRQAEQDALAAATALRVLGVGTALVDVSPRGQAFARELAAAADAWYVPLPHANARALSRAVGALSGTRPDHAA